MGVSLKKEYIHDFLHSYGYKMLGEYIDCERPIKVLCKQGHEITPNFNNLRKCLKKGRTGCVICSRKKKYTIEEVREVAEERGFKLLSTEYINNESPLEILCSNNHIFNIGFYGFKAGIGCAECNGTKKFTIEHVKEVAKNKGLEVLDDVYINSAAKLTIKCPKGHVYKTDFRTMRGHYCRKCRKYTTEERCRVAFQDGTGKLFPSVRPEWLINPKTGRRLELDGYCKELNIAFEYDGAQHFREVKHFGARDTLEKTQERDLIKNEICKERGIVLVRIPYVIKNVEDHIEKILRLLEIK